jgi:hypothetical protein
MRFNAMCVGKKTDLVQTLVEWFEWFANVQTKKNHCALRPSGVLRNDACIVLRSSTALGMTAQSRNSGRQSGGIKRLQWSRSQTKFRSCFIIPHPKKEHPAPDVLGAGCLGGMAAMRAHHCGR